MRTVRSLVLGFALALGIIGVEQSARADAEDDLARHMVGEALLAAHFVAAAEAPA